MKKFIALTINEAEAVKGGKKLDGDTLFCEWYISKTDNTHNAINLTGADKALLNNR